MIKLGLCCKWHDEQIKFRSTTVKKLLSLSPEERTEYLKPIIDNNLQALRKSVKRCAELGIGSFRVMSGLFPCSTHPEVCYDPFTEGVRQELNMIGTMALDLGVTLTTHPSQYIVMNSPNESVVEASIRDLEREAQLMNELLSPYIIIHAGGAYGDKQAALQRLGENLKRLSVVTRSFICVENDDKIFTAEDVYRFCKQYGYKMIFDLHHHRCLPSFGTFSEKEIAQMAAGTYINPKKAIFHISSPKEGWDSKKPNLHHDYIQDEDFPDWLWTMDGVLEIEAKHKEKAITKLLEKRG